MSKTLVRPTSKGQVTIPKAIRSKLNVDQETFLKVVIEGQNIVFKPVQFKDDKPPVRVYSDKQIEQFLKDDVLDAETIEFMNKLLGRKKY